MSRIGQASIDIYHTHEPLSEVVERASREGAVFALELDIATEKLWIEFHADHVSRVEVSLEELEDVSEMFKQGVVAIRNKLAEKA